MQTKVHGETHAERLNETKETRKSRLVEIAKKINAEVYVHDYTQRQGHE